MGTVQLPADVQRIVDRQVAEGRAASETAFLTEAVYRYAVALDADETAMFAAADDGLADLAAGRFEIIAGPEDVARLRAELHQMLDSSVAPPRGSAPP